MLFGVIDWVTWSIWLLGFAILIIWIIVPVREFRELYRTHKKAREGEAAPGQPAESQGIQE